MAGCMGRTCVDKVDCEPPVFPTSCFLSLLEVLEGVTGVLDSGCPDGPGVPPLGGGGGGLSGFSSESSPSLSLEPESLELSLDSSSLSWLPSNISISERRGLSDNNDSSSAGGCSAGLPFLRFFERFFFFLAWPSAACSCAGTAAICCSSISSDNVREVLRGCCCDCSSCCCSSGCGATCWCNSCRAL